MMIPIRYFTRVISSERTRINQSRIGAISAAPLGDRSYSRRGHVCQIGHACGIPTSLKNRGMVPGKSHNITEKTGPELLEAEPRLRGNTYMPPDCTGSGKGRGRNIHHRRHGSPVSLARHYP